MPVSRSNITSSHGKGDIILPSISSTAIKDFEAHTYVLLKLDRVLLHNNHKINLLDL